ncbi:ANTAR domain-containing response regulator [Streptomyces sp. B93]|uniref:ANTAR domain-containing response regulator n=1 Tax=Streptomyces sp. B93 TaxID=2824875 RepID=UPI001B362F25|nr:ANTAR domain-containing protein [Streptomyces sp. B93]MBQ1088072.1 ANTAR domain-containing protein [Streptomyces sp. B93]
MTSAVPIPPAVLGRGRSLAVDGHVDGSRAVLTTRGELVHGCTDVLARALADLPDAVSRIDADMSGVVFMDTAGLDFLKALRDHGDRLRVPVTARHWNGQPRRILELAGLDTTDPLRAPARRAPQEPTAPVPMPSAVALERAEQLHSLREEIEQLRFAISSRPVIDQARGILMAMHACTSEQAWHILREASQLSNTKLRTVAATVTASTERPDGPPPPTELREALRTALERCLN